MPTDVVPEFDDTLPLNVLKSATTRTANKLSEKLGSKIRLEYLNWRAWYRKRKERSSDACFTKDVTSLPSDNDSQLPTSKSKKKGCAHPSNENHGKSRNQAKKRKNCDGLPALVRTSSFSTNGTSSIDTSRSSFHEDYCSCNPGPSVPCSGPSALHFQKHLHLVDTSSSKTSLLSSKIRHDSKSKSKLQQLAEKRRRLRSMRRDYLKTMDPIVPGMDLKTYDALEEVDTLARTSFSELRLSDDKPNDVAKCIEDVLTMAVW